ncbi:MAG: aspartate--tRNA(Asn) ligase [archaeon]|nr:aspartate--tRNA(Asn) ligase [archaeon]
MDRIHIKEAFEKKAGTKVKLAGWVHDTRALGKVKFLVLRDVSGRIQTVAFKGETPDEAFEKVSKINRESVVIIEGTIKDAKQAPGGKELAVGNIEVLNPSEEQLPIDVSDFSKTELPKRLDYRFLDTRRPEVSAIFKIRSLIYKLLVEFYDKEGFTIINTPKLTTIGLESGAESFVVNYFDKKVVLAQSPQFYKQMFTMGGFERVFEIGPVYRAEKSHTTRHLTEFIGADFEMGFIKDENDVMDMAEKMMKFIIEKIKVERKQELELLKVELKVPKKIPRIPMPELKKILAKQGKKLSEDDDLDAEAERMLGEYALKEFGEEFIFVTNYPAKVRPFYHMRPLNDVKGTRSFDLLFRGVEVCTGAQREHRLTILQKQAKEKGVKIPQIYEDIFRFGAMPHGGIGFGLDRITQRLLNLDNTREAVLLPRDTERVTP